MATKALAKTASPVKKGGSIVDVAETIYGIPSIEVVKEALANGSKLYWDGETSESSFLLDVLNKAEKGQDLYAESNLASIDDHLGEALSVLSIDGVRNSDFEGGIGVYLIVSVAGSDGVIFKMAIGSTTPLAYIVYHHENNELPWKLKFVKSERPTKAGFYPTNVISLQNGDDEEPF